MFTLQNSINFAKTFIQYSPLTAGLGLEPAVSIATIIRNSLLGPPNAWVFNRNEVTFPTVVGQQDYNQASVTDLGFIEKVSLTNDQGNIIEIKDIYNTNSLSHSSFQQRPSAISIQSSDLVAGSVFRFLGVPDKIYTVTIVYQREAPVFGPFFITSNASFSGPNTTYTGSFNVASFPTGSIANISGYTAGNVANNGSFVVVSCTTTTLVVANAAGVASVQAGYVSNLSWNPIPDQFSDIYNNLFLSEAMALVDDSRAQLYRQRGVAAFISKATGLTDTQKNVFVQQWLARDSERAGINSGIQLGNTAKGI